MTLHFKDCVSESLHSSGSVLLGLLPDRPQNTQPGASRLPFDGGKTTPLAVRHLLRSGGGCGGREK